MGWLDRVAATDYKVDDKLTIPAGTPVYVNGLSLHYDPNIYPEPMQFNPDRFLPENEKKIPPFTYIPFGEGPRMCIGNNSFNLVHFVLCLINEYHPILTTVVKRAVTCSHESARLAR
ncbi:Cytochrome P450 6j1 [Papilio xuthus]|uniref:unspecific monooxygenase n=1 Tax=Papilio xuthus TaxID=66420 RepID=A0A194QGA0_PAPXU|nr:Cytochrome P450 6j1 [Papilio xuthus]